MNKKLIELAQRKAALVHRVERQRTELAQTLMPWLGPLALVDKGWLVARYLGRHPALLSTGLTLAAAVFPKGVLGWVRRGLLMWQTAVAIKRSLLR